MTENKDVNKEQEEAETWETKSVTVARAVLAELLCTTIFMFVVTATGVEYARTVDLAHAENIHDSTIAGISSMLIAVGIIYSFADVSGAHFNPAVTFATVVSFKNSIVKGILYIIAQLIGSVLAALLLATMYPEGLKVVKSVAVKKDPDVTTGQAFFLEMLLTFIFVYVIFATAFDSAENVTVTTGSKGQASVSRKLVRYSTTAATKSGFAPIAIACTLGACVFASDAISGGGFNPARVFGFALVGDVWNQHWLYWTAHFLGAAMASYVQKLFSKPHQVPQVHDLGTLLKWFFYLDEVPALTVQEFLKTWVWG
eukprot:TRINITY_DN2648_c0_g1_i1.p1 TRINITY_DN2648_c0_g1~~TRINITY_DN2648_c0_g1_i1.p1  ORF type:complete len:313 (-),score=49.35 TRINITY_DN2648_c0_g1_i1:42-980(-)